MPSRDPSKFSLPELAALIVLMSEDRELSNPEMIELVGFALPAHLASTSPTPV